MAIQPRRRRSAAGRLFPFVTFGFVVLAGLIVYTVINGELRIPFLSDSPVFAFQKEERVAPRSAPAGTVPVLANPRPLPAYTRISRDHLLADPQTVYTLPVAESIAEDAGLFIATAENLSKLRGRVLARDKAAGFAFSESDLLPAGTRGGLSAGIPPGKRGLWVDAQKVDGLADLQLGDRFDLIAARQVPVAKPSQDLGELGDAVGSARLAMQLKTMQASVSEPGPQARAWVVVHDGVVVRPMRIREIPLSSTTAFQGTRTQTRPVQEVFLAMEPEEVAKLSQALATKAEVRCSPRSGRPDDDDGVRTPDVDPEDPMEGVRELLEGLTGGEKGGLSMVEVIRGEQRDAVTVERSGER